jgi:hypothetical protein
MKHTIYNYFRLSINMKKIFSLLFISIFLSQILSAQKLLVEVNYVTADEAETKALIYYSPSEKLTWNDFKGKPVLSSNAAAITNAGIGFKMKFHSNNNVTTLHITVTCNFSIADSWVKDGRRTPYILNHEQHHFDIAYINARQFVQNLKAAKYTQKDYDKVIEKIYYQAQADLQTMQNAYDSETKNSMLPEMQDVWNKKIDAQIALLAKQ